ncbi:MAG: DNA polymerase III subunit delta [Mycoplasmataceae bacterium]|nr:DNA polymerase III subunit delta [Mycoplasmataceae bacterium]
MYFIYGEELFLIKKEIKKICNENSDVIPIVFHSDCSIYDFINEINTFSIFQDKKIVILNDFYLLNKSNTQDEKEVINSINNKNENCILIFVYSEASPKIKTPLFKFLQDKANKIEIKKYTNSELVHVIRKIVESKGGVISNMNCILLSTKLPNDLNLIIQEIDKLLLEENEISKNMILTSVSKYSSDNIFEFINSFNDKDASGLFRGYKEKINNGESITNLMSQLSNALILCTTINSYIKSRVRLEEIAVETKIHIFRIKKANELLKSYGIDKISNLIEMLSELDNDIKSGTINEVIGFEKLLLEIIR